MRESSELDIEKKIADSYELPNYVLTAIPSPVVSVRTSTYQHAAYIRQCIEGVLMQKTVFPFEYIIGEDFSTDGTREIVFEYARRYPEKIRVITADYNVGMKANGLRCERAIRGRYVAICEGDDCWTDPLKLQQQVEVLECWPHVSLCFHNALVEYVGALRASHPFGSYDREIYAIEDVIDRWFVPTASVVYRWNWLRRPSWLNYVFNGDYAALLLLALEGPFYCINKIMSVYRKHPSSITAVHPLHHSALTVRDLLCYFDMETNFTYHDRIVRRVNRLADDLYKAFLYDRPRWSRLLSADYYLYRMQGFVRVMREQRRKYGWRLLPSLARELAGRFK